MNCWSIIPQIMPMLMVAAKQTREQNTMHKNKEDRTQLLSTKINSKTPRCECIPSFTHHFVIYISKHIILMHFQTVDDFLSRALCHTNSYRNPIDTSIYIYIYSFELSTFKLWLFAFWIENKQENAFAMLMMMMMCVCVLCAFNRKLLWNGLMGDALMDFRFYSPVE